MSLLALATAHSKFKTPFVPRYSILGVVDPVGEGVTQVAVGERVVALTTLGGHAEYIYLDERKLVHVPETLNPAEAVMLILNYLVAYPVMHRTVQVKPDDKVLIIGVSSVDGSAFLQIGRLAGLKMYGLASPSKHNILTENGATPIDYHSQDFIQLIQQAEPDSLDYVFNGMGEEYLRGGLQVLRRGGVMVHYGAPQSFSRFLVFLVEFILFNLLPNGKTIKGYGTHRIGGELMKEDWLTLFNLLGEDKIKPIIYARYPQMEAARAYELLESSQVTGNIVLYPQE